MPSSVRVRKVEVRPKRGAWIALALVLALAGEATGEEANQLMLSEFSKWAVVERAEITTNLTLGPNGVQGTLDVQIRPPSAAKDEALAWEVARKVWPSLRMPPECALELGEMNRRSEFGGGGWIAHFTLRIAGLPHATWLLSVRADPERRMTVRGNLTPVPSALLVAVREPRLSQAEIETVLRRLTASEPLPPDVVAFFSDKPSFQPTYDRMRDSAEVRRLELRSAPPYVIWTGRGGFILYEIDARTGQEVSRASTLLVRN